MLDARTFVDILRTNPGTDTIPVIVTASAEEVDEAMRDAPGALLRKPYNLDEVLAHIDDLLARAERARSDAAEPQEIEGALAQLALPGPAPDARARPPHRAGDAAPGDRARRGGAGRGPAGRRARAARSRERRRCSGSWLGGRELLLPARSAAPRRLASAGARTSSCSRRRARPTSAGGCWRPCPEPATRWVQAPGAALRAVPPLAREVLARLETPRSTPELLDAVEAAGPRGAPGAWRCSTARG